MSVSRAENETSIEARLEVARLANFRTIPAQLVPRDTRTLLGPYGSQTIPPVVVVVVEARPEQKDRILSFPTPLDPSVRLDEQTGIGGAKQICLNKGGGIPRVQAVAVWTELQTPKPRFASEFQ